MTMKFKDFRSLIEAAQGADPQDYKDKVDDKESTTLKGRSANDEKMKKTAAPKKKKPAKHPVAPESQFTGTTKSTQPHDGYEHGKGETKPVKQGSSKIKEAVEGYFNPPVIDESFSISDLQSWAKSSNKSYKVKFDNGERETVSSDMSKSMMETYNKLSASNKKKFESNMCKSSSSFMKIAGFGG